MQRFGLKPMAVVVFVVMTACNFPRSPLPTPDLNATVAAKVRDTLTASSPTASPRGPSATPSKPPSMPTVVPSPSPAPPAQTPSPAPSRLVVSVETNCRKGPGEAFERIGVLLVGQEAEVLGRSTSGDYWVVRLPDGHVCWLWGQYATVTGDRPIPPMTPPPTPGLATVKGRIFHDTNRNGKQDGGSLQRPDRLAHSRHWGAMRWPQPGANLHHRPGRLPFPGRPGHLLRDPARRPSMVCLRHQWRFDGRRSIGFPPPRPGIDPRFRRPRL